MIIPDPADTPLVLAEYHTWLRATYSECFTILSATLIRQGSAIREQCFDTMLRFLHAETVFGSLSGDRTAELVGAVLTTKNGELLAKLTAEVSDLDWKYATLKAIGRFSKQCQGTSDMGLADVVHILLTSIDVSECFTKELLGRKKPTTPAEKTMFHIRKAFGVTWLEFLKVPKSRALYLTILTSLHEAVIPKMQNPKLLCDFLVDSYNLGGTASLLALNSLFLLITDYNLDYPSFYPKLYRMCTPDLLHTPYLGRFLSMLDTFLKSPLLPGYMVAAFIKRLTRNSLTAPPHAIIQITRLTTNLLKLHPSTKRLVHRGPDHKPAREDPWNPDDEDPATCGALDSSLWELELLKDHLCPEVGVAIGTLRKPTDEILVEMGLHRTHTNMYKEYVKQWKKDPAAEFQEPTSFDGLGDVFSF